MNTTEKRMVELILEGQIQTGVKIQSIFQENAIH